MQTARSVTVFFGLCGLAGLVGLVGLAGLGGCGGNNGTPADAPPDIDNGTCGSQLRFTGEYVDWDSSDNAPCGIFGPTFTIEGGASTTFNAPNGRFDLCVPDQAVTLVDIAPPQAASQCASGPGPNPQPEMYTMPAIAVANKAEIAAGGAWSGRAFGALESTVPTPDPAKAQVFVHVTGNAVAVSIVAVYGATQARVGTTWGAGTTGTDVYFSNVDPTGGSTMLTAANAIGTGSIPLVAGKMTNVSIVVP